MQYEQKLLKTSCKLRILPGKISGSLMIYLDFLCLLVMSVDIVKSILGAVEDNCVSVTNEKTL